MRCQNTKLNNIQLPCWTDAIRQGFIYVILVSLGSPFIPTIIAVESLFYFSTGEAPECHVQNFGGCANLGQVW
nr:MAG TPA: hypothetical protein [Caudoviricetes sp.]